MSCHVSTEGEDFNPLMSVLDFTPSVLENCVNVGVINDSVVENTEVFFVTVNSNDPVTFNLESVTVSIIDQDGMLSSTNSLVVAKCLSMRQIIPCYISAMFINFYHATIKGNTRNHMCQCNA